MLYNREVGDIRRNMETLKRSKWNTDRKKIISETKSVLNNIDYRSDIKEVNIKSYQGENGIVYDAMYRTFWNR